MDKGYPTVVEATSEEINARGARSRSGSGTGMDMDGSGDSSGGSASHAPDNTDTHSTHSSAGSVTGSVTGSSNSSDSLPPPPPPLDQLTLESGASAATNMDAIARWQGRASDGDGGGDGSGSGSGNGSGSGSGSDGGGGSPPLDVSDVAVTPASASGGRSPRSGGGAGGGGGTEEGRGRLKRARTMSSDAGTEKGYRSDNNDTISKDDEHYDEDEEEVEAHRDERQGLVQKRPRLTNTERLERSRERNRIHARKTRQRKKAQLTNLQEEMEALKEKNAELSQAVNKHMAAIVLLVLRAPDSSGKTPGLEEALGGLPPLVGQAKEEDGDGDGNGGGSSNGSVNGSSEGGNSGNGSEKGSGGGSPRSSPISSLRSSTEGGDTWGSEGMEFSENGEPKLNGMILGVAEMAQMDIDLELMRKDRSQCTQQELNQIRRERNRMHAKRTRVRKKVQMEEIQETINKLEETNHALTERLAWLGSKSFTVLVEDDPPAASIPENDFERSADDPASIRE